MSGRLKQLLCFGASVLDARDWTNTGWVLGERVLRLVGGLVVGTWVARHLGPVGYGVISHALAVTGTFALLLHFGMDVALLRDLAREPERKRVVLSTHLVIRAAGGMLALGGVQILAALAGAGRDLWAAATIMSVAMLWRVGEIWEIADNAERNQRRPALVRIVATVVGAAVKAALIACDAPLWAFGAAAGLDMALTGIVFAGVALRRGGFRVGEVSFSYAWSLRGEMAWAMLAALCMLVLSRLDQICLGFVGAEKDMGGYAAAVRLVEAGQLIPMSMLAALAPALFAPGARDAHALNRAAGRLQRQVGSVAFGGALLLTLFAAPLVRLLYGADYAGAGALLRGYAWVGFATVVLSINSRWLYARNLGRLNCAFLVVGALVAVFANALLVPRWHAMGALTATLAGMFATSFVAPVLFSEGRPLAKLWWTSLVRTHRMETRWE